MKKKLIHGSTFSGIGAPEIAAEMLGWGNAFHCEINPFGRRVLDYYFPDAKSYEDITKTDFSEWRGRIDVLTGGFPCQPFSYAGKRKGSEDDRYLWPYMLKCIEQVQPSWFVGENVSGIGTMVFPGQEVKVGSNADIFQPGDIYRTDERFVLYEIIQNLESIGYSVQPFVIPACAVGAPHRRDRVFIIAHRVVSDSACGGSGTQGEGGGSACNGSHGLLLQGERRDEAKRTDGLHEVQGIIADTNRSNNECRESREDEGEGREERLQERDKIRQLEQPVDVRSEMRESAPDTSCRTLQNCRHDGECMGEEDRERPSNGCSNGGLQIDERLLPEERWRAFPTVPPIHRGNDGIPFDVDSLTISFSEWKRESLKAYGNAIVPQVMYEIFNAIDQIENNQS